MNKKILALALAAVAALGINAAAQSKDNGKAAAKTEQSQAKADNKMARPHRFTDFAFEGILLDIPQQARMDSLNAAVKAQAEQRKDDERGPRRGGMNPQMRRDYVAKVKEILTPEQYTMFLENIVFMPENAGAPRHDQGMRQDRGRKQGMEKGRPAKDNKGMKHGKRPDGQKGDKAKAKKAETPEAQQK